MVSRVHLTWRRKPLNREGGFIMKKGKRPLVNMCPEKKEKGKAVVTMYGGLGRNL